MRRVWLSLVVASVFASAPLLACSSKDPAPANDKTPAREGRDAAAATAPVHPDRPASEARDDRSADPKTYWAREGSAPLDLEKLDASAFLPEALEAARRRWRDAVLVAIKQVAIDASDGTSSLTREMVAANGTVSYGFRRPPVPAPGMSDCMLWIHIDDHSVYEATECESAYSKLPALSPLPRRCSARDILTRLAATHGQAVDRIHEMSWTLEEENGNVIARWRVSGYPTGEGGKIIWLSTSLPDTCGASGR